VETDEQTERETSIPVDKTSSETDKGRQIDPEPGAEGSAPRVRDNWDKMEILLRPGAAFLTALTVALIGWFGQQALDKRATEQTTRLGEAQKEETVRAEAKEKEITRRTQISQNYRLYTQLLSNREESESALRKDIFSSILKEFLTVSASGMGHENIRNRLLKLEILALNFGEALSLSPLFIELDKNIRETVYDTEFARLDKADDRKRLESLAKRVSLQQISALSTGGYHWDFEIPIDKIADDTPYKWPYDSDETEYYPIVLEDIERNYVFEFSKTDTDYHSVSVELEIHNASEFISVEQKFNLNFFNFPMVDNTRLSNDQRFALIMTKFEDKAIHFSAIVFPGKYSSQRDKPFLDDVIHRLRNENLKQSSQQEQGEVQ